MVNVEDIVKLIVTEEDLKECVKKSLCENLKYVDNLRFRHPNVRFDCLVRGCIGENAILKWFEEHGILFKSVKQKLDDDFNIDIDLIYEANGRDIKIEVKTSLVPDKLFNKYSNNNRLLLEKILESCDIKLIRRTRNGRKENIDELRGDIHLQIYFLIPRRERDILLENLKINCNIASMCIAEVFDKLVEKIYNEALIHNYMSNIFLVGWIDKETLITFVRNKYIENPTWSYGKREFWRCNIKKDAKPPRELISYLENLKKKNM